MKTTDMDELELNLIIRSAITVARRMGIKKELFIQMIEYVWEKWDG